VSYGQINPYSFMNPIAPHIASRKAGVRIDFARILTSYHELAAQADRVIIEGAGGFRVPLNDNQDTADLIAQLNLPVILVVGIRLGCINHALLTASAIEACGLKCAGWVANVVDADMLALQDNIVAIQQRLAAPLFGVIPWQSQPDAKEAAMQLKLALLEELDGSVEP
jgi:dethiobiotin synthetase